MNFTVNDKRPIYKQVISGIIKSIMVLYILFVICFFIIPSIPIFCCFYIGLGLYCIYDWSIKND